MATSLYPLSIRRGIARPHPEDDHCRHDGLRPGAQAAARPMSRLTFLKAEAGMASTLDRPRHRSDALRPSGGA